MGVGGRNRLMQWTGTTIPYKPGKNDLLEATRRVGAVIGAGGVVAIAGEGRIGAVRDGTPAAQRRAPPTSRCDRASRSCRSRSTARAGSGSVAGPGAGRASP